MAGGMEKGSPGPGPSPLAPLDVCLDRGNSGLLLLIGEQWVREAIGTLEWREPRGRAGESVVSIFNPQQMFRPGQGLLLGDATQSSLQFLVNPLHLSIALWMEPG